MSQTIFYRSKQIDKGVTRIFGAGNELMYLVEGTERAVLIDTGTGVGNIREYVESLTNLPITVILTHGHIDHASGAFYFDSVYLHNADNGLLEEIAQYKEKFDQERIEFVEGANKALSEKIAPDDLPQTKELEVLPLTDGQLFDLGGITLEILTCPGHTHGSVMILMRELRTILFGDSCNTSVWMYLNESTGIQEYKNSLLKIKSREADYDKILFSHDTTKRDKDILDELIHVCDMILQDQSEDIPVTFGNIGSGFIAKREDGRAGNIVHKKMK